ncbi:MAG: 6-carboxytetrahydropterin synthase [Calditrichaeota bacterium]|nr:MAG: 6-carboxytetrahydropterin synthase [Calditrichota bacterium]
MIHLVRKVQFCAAHRLHTDKLSIEENKRVYGICNNENGHGHNYELEVTIAGEVDPITGMVMDLKELKEIIEKEIVDKVDHKNLNFDVDFLEGLVPTAEVVTMKFWEILEDKIPHGKLYRIRLWESSNNVVEFYGN